MPAARRAGYRAFFTTGPDEMLGRSVELFRFVAQGGADGLSGQYVGRQLDGFDTPNSIAASAHGR